MKFTQGTSLNTDGEMVPAWGFEHADMFIVNAHASTCGRFHASPAEYGLTEKEAVTLAMLNAGRDLLAYWDI